MKKLIYLLLLTSLVVLNSCAEQRVGERYVKKSIEAASSNKIGEGSSLYFVHHTNIQYCNDINLFLNIYKLNMFLLDSMLGAFKCYGTLSEFIIAVEIDKTGSNGVLFLFFRPNFANALNNNNNNLANTNYIQLYEGNYFRSVIVELNFTIHNNQSFNSFGNINATLDSIGGVLTMQTNNGIDYILNVSTMGQTQRLIYDAQIERSK